MTSTRLAISELRRLSWGPDLAIAARARAAVRIIRGVPIDFVAEALRVDIWALMDAGNFFRPVNMPTITRSKQHV